MSGGGEEASEAPELSNAAALAQARISLKQAIGTAEQRTESGVVEAALEGENGVVVCKVAVLKGSAEQEVVVDAKTGAVVMISAGESEEDEAAKLLEGAGGGADRD